MPVNHLIHFDQTFNKRIFGGNMLSKETISNDYNATVLFLEKRTKHFITIKNGTVGLRHIFSKTVQRVLYGLKIHPVANKPVAHIFIVKTELSISCSTH